MPRTLAYPGDRPETDADRYLARCAELDQAAANGEDIGDRLAGEKLTRDTRLVDEIVERSRTDRQPNP